MAAAGACLEEMRDPDPVVARLAAEAFSGITGLEISGELAAATEPEPEEPVPLAAEDLADDPVPPPEMALPPPRVEAVAAWWAKAGPDFDPQARYLGGKPFGRDALMAALERGPMRRRYPLALELGIRSRGACRVPVRARGRAQLAALESARSLPPASFAQPFDLIATF